VKEEVVKTRLAVLAVGIVLVLTACTPAAPESGVTIENGVQHVTYVSGNGAEEYRFSPASLTLDAGQVQITYQNNGDIIHELMLLDASDPDKLQEFIAAHENEEEGGMEAEEMVPGVMIIPELEDVETGTSQTTDVFDLPAGSYIIACMKPGHYEKGMSMTLVVQ